IQHQIGLLYASTGDIALARQEYLKVINGEKSVDAKYLRIVSRSLHNMGHTYLLEKEFEVALKYYQKALKLKNSNKDKFITLKDIGICYNEMGEYDSALIYLNEAEKIFSFVTPVKDNSEIYHALDYTYHQLGQYELSQNAAATYHQLIVDFIEIKEGLIAQYSAAEIASVIAAHHKDSNHKQTTEQYLWYIAIAGGLCLILGFSFLLVKIAYQKSLKREKEFKQVGREFSGFVDNLSKKS
ncbi:MAG: tetratricopeptide repeat protein, partial [Cyclobacteriaceae bacterium]